MTTHDGVSVEVALDGRPPGPGALATSLGERIRPSPAPCLRRGADLWRAARTPDGPVTVRLRAGIDAVTVQAWGPGSDWVGARASEWVGAGDDPAAVEPAHDLVERLRRRAVAEGRRWGRTGLVVDPLLSTIIGQKVPSRDAREVRRRLHRLLGSPPPSAPDLPAGLVLPPAPADLARLADHTAHRLGLEATRTRRLREVARRARALERAGDLPTEAATALLTAVPGVGPWSASRVLGAALGDPDVPIVGDYKIPHHVCWALARERTGDDERMLELLAPYEGQRGRVQGWIVAMTPKPPRRGPRLDVPDIRRI